MAAAPASSDGSDPTSVCIAGAVAGDTASRDFLVERFSPVLLVQARYRMQSLVRGAEPEDVVQETWAAALPKLRDLRPRDGRWTPVLLKFLSVILLRAVNELLRRSLRRRGGDVGRGGDPATAVDPLAQLPAAVSGIVTRLARSDRGCLVQQALARLAPDEREVVVLRGIEQLPNREVARMLGIDDSAVTRRFQRAMQRLRDLLPGSVFDEME
ncbi:MAG: sigma-70 family RNA polymerase sigma factor [Planctomycetes bacterium]|jgi:RNA polymerase sigma factor (sigma-70 family)|nr:sigma-70 family RNA polymerase sigma factor [Planctomycetota bacterium]